METKFTKEYFIEKFEAIPKENWCEGDLQIVEEGVCKNCALGHCKVSKMDDLNEEAIELSKLLKPIHDELYLKGNASEVPYHACYVYQINDLADKLGYTPKERILNALKSLP